MPVLVYKKFRPDTPKVLDISKFMSDTSYIWKNMVIDQIKRNIMQLNTLTAC